MKRSDRKTNQQAVYTSKFGDETERGTAQQICAKYEARGYEAERDKDHMLAQQYFQHAEYYKKLALKDRGAA